MGNCYVTSKNIFLVKLSIGVCCWLPCALARLERYKFHCSVQPLHVVSALAMTSKSVRKIFLKRSQSSPGARAGIVFLGGIHTVCKGGVRSFTA